LTAMGRSVDSGVLLAPGVRFGEWLHRLFGFVLAHDSDVMSLIERRKEDGNFATVAI